MKSDEGDGEGERKAKRDIPGPCKRTEKAMELEGVGDTNCKWCT